MMPILQATIEERVTNLEGLMAQLIHVVTRVELQVEQLSYEMRGFKDEMRGFKDEMLEFKDEMLEFKDEMREFKDEMRGFKDEMLEFKDEMRDFKDEMSDSKTEMNKKWGELANKMGTLAEDIVAPSIPRILRLVIECPNDGLDSMAVRVRRRHPVERGRMQEFDVVAMCGEYVLINETKSSLYVRDVDDFIRTLSQTREFFPEYADKKIIGALASLYVDERVVQRAQKKGLLVLGMTDEAMDLLNEPGFEPLIF